MTDGKYVMIYGVGSSLLDVLIYDILWILFGGLDWQALRYTTVVLVEIVSLFEPKFNDWLRF